MDQRIVKYYRICAIAAPRIHPVANIDIAPEIISEYESQVYFMSSKGVLIPKETIIGGWQGGNGNVEKREKIIVIGSVSDI